MREFKMGKATRLAYGEAILELGRKNSNIVVLDADLSKSTMSNVFAKEIPERFFNIGIAEANLVSIAAGMALSGKIPFASSFATFLMSKGYDQMRQSVAYPGVNAKFVGSHSGISIGEDGPSQMAIEDIALACSLPGFTVVVPADETAVRKLLTQIVEMDGPVFLRTGRPKAPIIYDESSKLELGKANILQKGKDLTIIAMGLMVAEALMASDMLKEKGISAGVIDMHTVKPIDSEALRQAAEQSGAILCVEEHVLNGGLGSEVAREVAQQYPVPMEFIGLSDYAESGTPDELLDKYGLRAVNIYEKAIQLVERKIAKNKIK